MAIGVVIVEDAAHYRASLEALVSEEAGWELAGSYPNAEPLLEEARHLVARRDRFPWRLVLMDIQLPGIGGIEATRELKRLYPGAWVVALTVFEEPATILEAICAGADGYLLKKTPAPELIAQLQAIVDGGSPLTPQVARVVTGLLRQTAGGAPTGPAPNRFDLSEREQEVLRGLSQGLSYKQVADRLSLSVDTVRTYIRRIYRKLQVHSVSEAVSRAIRERLV